MKILKTIFLILSIAIIGIMFFLFQTEYKDKEFSDKENLIKVESPLLNEEIESPLIIKGEARGTWFFEASFPIKLFDENNVLLATGLAQAKDDSMTEDFVPFEAIINFDVPNTKKGALVLEKDNPSGLFENADELRIDIRFKDKAEEMTIDLYCYNPNLDKDESGNVLCSEQGIVKVQRNIPLTIAPAQDAIKLLIKGELWQEEIESGITTEYPLEGFELKGASLKDGVLTLNFNDPKNKTIGGSCRVNVLWLQISKTAKQFKGVETVEFTPEYIFQP